MAARRRMPGPGRPLLRAILAVGEGDAEELLLRHVRSLMHGMGVRITVKQAQGKGALGVINYAIRQRAVADFDVAIALLDIDTDWSAAAKKKASEGLIEVVPCEPCFEAMVGHVATGTRTECLTKAHKAAFRKHFGCDAHDVSMERWYQQAWPEFAAFAAAAQRVQELARLHALLTT